TGYPAFAGYDNHMWLSALHRWAADALIDEAGGFHVFGAVDVAEVDDDGLRHGRLQPVEVERPELHPFGDDDDRIGAFRAGIGILAIGDVRQLTLGLLHADGIEGLHLRAHVDETGHQRDRRR